MEVRLSTAVTRGFFFSFEVARYLIDHTKGKKNPLAPRVGSAKRFLKFNWAATLTFDSIFYSGAITCFFYPSANWTLLLQERTDHLGAQPVKIHLYPNCFSSSVSFVLTAILNFKRVAAVH